MAARAALWQRLSSVHYQLLPDGRGDAQVRQRGHAPPDGAAVLPRRLHHVCQRLARRQNRGALLPRHAAALPGHGGVCHGRRRHQHRRPIHGHDAHGGCGTRAGEPSTADARARYRGSTAASPRPSRGSAARCPGRRPRERRRWPLSTPSPTPRPSTRPTCIPSRPSLATSAPLSTAAGSAPWPLPPPPC